jgi:TetR/AcrR family transcriptional repressor of lmrAB and yxaGH operons
MMADAMAPRGQTRKRILDTMARLLVTQGFRATGLNQVLAESGAPRGSLYFHFPGGKLELAVEAVRALGVELGKTIDALLDGERTVEEGLERLCGMYAAQLRRSRYRRGCPIATVALEASAGPPELLDACAAVFDAWECALAVRLQREGVPARRARDAATSVLAVLEGALLLAKARRDATPLLRASETLSAILHR